MLPARNLSDARAVEFTRRGVMTSEMTGEIQRRERSAQRLARIAGLLCLIPGVLWMFAATVLGSVVVRGDAAATADNVLGSRWLFASSLVVWIAIVAADIAVAVTLYLLLTPVGRAGSLLAAAFRLVYSAILGAVVLNLFDAFLLLTDARRGGSPDESRVQSAALSAFDTFNVGVLDALIFLGAHMLTLGILLYRSRFVPRVLSVLLGVAGVGCIVDSLAKVFAAEHGGLASAVLLAPAVVAQLGLSVWLLVKGLKAPQPARAT
jgi:hypothetical protein